MLWLINLKRHRLSRTKNKKQPHLRNLAAITINIIKIPARDNNSMYQAPIELPQLTVKTIVWPAQAIAHILITQLQLKCVPVIIKVLLLPCFKINNLQLIQLRIKEKELHSSRDKSKKWQSSRGTAQQIVVLIHNKWLLLKFISNKCTRLHRLHRQLVRTKCVKVSKMPNNKEKSQRSKSSANILTINNPAQFI